MGRSKPPSNLSLEEFYLALSIVEGPSLKVSGTKLVGGRGRRFKRLLDLGALVRRERAATIICQECDRRHRAMVEFDRDLQAETYFCSEAGRVIVEPKMLDVYELRLEWLLSWLQAAFRIPETQRPMPLRRDHLWELGEASIHHQRLRIMLARRIGSLARLTEIETITARRSGKTGLILATSPSFSEPQRLPNGFSMISLEEVLVEDRRIAAVDLDRLLAIAEPEAIIDPYSTGLPIKRSGAHFVDQEHERRIAEGQAHASIGEEARELRRWFMANYSDGPPLAVRTIENRIRERHNRYKACMRCTN